MRNPPAPRTELQRSTKKFKIQTCAAAELFEPLVLLFGLDADERECTVAFSCQSRQSVNHCRRDYWHWRLTTASWRFRARHDVNVNRDGRVEDVWRNVTVEITLFHSSFLQRDCAFRHQLRQAKRQPRLKLTFNRQ